MRRRRKKKESGAPKWMVTYSDMVTLILVFFILLFSMSQVDIVKFQEISESFRNRMIFDFYPSAIPMEHPTESRSHTIDGTDTNDFGFPSQDSTIVDEEDSLQNLMTDINNFLNEH